MAAGQYCTHHYAHSDAVGVKAEGVTGSSSRSSRAGPGHSVVVAGAAEATRSCYSCTRVHPSHYPATQHAIESIHLPFDVRLASCPSS